MRTELLDYPLPEALIARWPNAQRDASRLLVVERDRVCHRCFADWPELLTPGSLLVLNDSRVLKARIVGARKPGGGRVELLLLRRLDVGDPNDVATVERWRALGHANRPLRSGHVIEADGLTAEVLEREPQGVLTVSMRAVGGVRAALERVGHVPIPPYLRRPDAACDVERYQTVYARRDGSVAAPTAGLHLTGAVLQRIRDRGVTVGSLTLHVGLGTFRPVTSDDLDDHPMHEEWFEIPPELVAGVDHARRAGKPVVAVGTTAVRALESAADEGRVGHIVAGAKETRLLIQPGYRFRVVDALLTNFHQPRSTLMALVSAFAGLDRIREAYRVAVQKEYRFLSYGDAMWIPERLA